MKWAERWIARAQRKADARDERYRRGQAGELPLSLMQGLIARRQAALDWRKAQYREQRDALLGRYPEVTSYAEAYGLLRYDAPPLRGPDRVEVAVWCAVSDRIWIGWALPSRWHQSRAERLRAVARYCVTFPLKPWPYQEIHSAFAKTMSGPPVKVARHFPSREEAVLYAALLAKRVQAGGVEALRQEARLGYGEG